MQEAATTLLKVLKLMWLEVRLNKWALHRKKEVTVELIRGPTLTSLPSLLFLQGFKAKHQRVTWLEAMGTKPRSLPEKWLAMATEATNSFRKWWFRLPPLLMTTCNMIWPTNCQPLKRWFLIRMQEELKIGKKVPSRLRYRPCFRIQILWIWALKMSKRWALNKFIRFNSFNKWGALATTAIREVQLDPLTQLG